MSVQHDLPVSLAEWDDHWTNLEENYELVKGVPLMMSSERVPNLRGAARLIVHLTNVLGAELDYLPNLEILIEGDPRPTVRRPDLVVVAQDPDSTAYRIDGGVVLLAVEFLSPSTASTDQREKAAEYARVGIPAYLLVDLRETDAETMTLLTEPTSDGYRERVDGDKVIVSVGAQQVSVAVAELVAHRRGEPR